MGDLRGAPDAPRPTPPPRLHPARLGLPAPQKRPCAIPLAPPPLQQRPQIAPAPSPTPHCSWVAAGSERSQARRGLRTPKAPTHPRLRTGARSAAGAPWWLPSVGGGCRWQLSLRVPGSPGLARSRLARGSSGTSAPSAPPPHPGSAGEFASLPEAARAGRRAPASPAARGCLDNRARRSSAPRTLPARNSQPCSARRLRVLEVASHAASLHRGPASIP
ncbi:uncharacterized protein LOC103789601 [Callithrix jacchus]